MSRRNKEAAEHAANAASEAARTLGQRSAEVRAERASEPAAAPEAAEKHPFRNVQPRNDPRRLAMEEIEQRDMRENKWKAGDEPVAEAKKPEIPDNPPPPTPEQMLHGSKHSQPEPEAPAADAPPAAPEAQPAPAMVKVKINGTEREVAQTEIDEYGSVAEYRMAKAAEERFEKFKREMAEERRQVEERAKAVAPPPPPSPSLTEEMEAFWVKNGDAFTFGTPQEKARIMMEAQSIQAKAAPKPVDQNALIEQAMMAIEHRNAVKEFDKEFADVASNPLLVKLAVAMRSERIPLEKGPIDWSNFYRKIGNEIRGIVGRPSQPSTAPAVPATTGNPSQGQSEKEARKASIVNLPTASVRAELPKDSKPETREDILNEMRKKRGIPTG